MITPKVGTETIIAIDTTVKSPTYLDGIFQGLFCCAPEHLPDYIHILDDYLKDFESGEIPMWRARVKVSKRLRDAALDKETQGKKSLKRKTRKNKKEVQ